jgi:putative glutamine amidotransferase
LFFHTTNEKILEFERFFRDEVVIMHPCIGISCNPVFSDEENQWKFRHYVEAIEATGGLPKLINSLEIFTRLQPQLDGLLIPGGADIQPVLYGEEAHPLLEAGNPARDELELVLIRWALREDMPVLGICRGMQLINVALGGTLYQDLADQYPQTLEHNAPDESRCHRVRVQAGSHMARIVDTAEFWVNSRHHQAIKDPGKGVSISGLADDGVAELCEVAGYRLVIGAQCHPENIYAEVPACARLFSALIEESSRIATDMAS